MKTKTVQVKKSLHVKLTQEEFNDHAIELAKLMSERDRIESSLASMRSSFKASIDETTAKIAKERQLVQEGREWRDVHCTVVYDYDERRVITTRTDTGEVIEDRAMRLDEMQMEMDFTSESENVADAVEEEEPTIPIPAETEDFFPDDNDEEADKEFEVLLPRRKDKEPYSLLFHSGKKSYCIAFRNEREFFVSGNFKIIDDTYRRVALRLGIKLNTTLAPFIDKLRERCSNNILVALLDLLPDSSAQESEYYIAAARNLFMDADISWLSVAESSALGDAAI